MLNYQDIEFDSEKVHSLKLTLENRLNLLNTFIPLIKKNHKSYTLDNIGVNLDEIKQIEEFMKKSTSYLDDLSENFKDFFLSYGTDWQKSRILK